MEKKKLVILTGPTAVGKTALSIRLAKEIGGEIISADSMQVYRRMDIGSAKITHQEMQGVAHHLVDILEPTENFDVCTFQTYAKRAMQEIYDRGNIPIIVGGTGFYIQAFLYDIDFSVGSGNSAQMQTGEAEIIRDWSGTEQNETDITLAKIAKHNKTDIYSDKDTKHNKTDMHSDKATKHNGTGINTDCIHEGQNTINESQNDTSESQNDIRAELMKIAQEKGAAYLHDMLRKVDPASAQAIHENNVKRVIRALEYYRQTGERISEHNERERQKESPYDFCYFVLTDNRERLYARIEQRIDEMLRQGLVREVEGLLKEGLQRGMTAMQGLGYKEIAAYLTGETTYEEAVYLLKRDTRHFAKRQLTWFRRERDVIWVDKEQFDYDEERMLAYMKQCFGHEAE